MRFEWHFAGLLTAIIGFRLDLEVLGVRPVPPRDGSQAGRVSVLGGVSGLHFDVRRFLAAFGGALTVFALVVWVGAASGGGAASSPATPVLRVNHPRVVILKGKRQLHLFDGEVLVRTYPVDLGTTPTGQKRHAGDGRTPEGSFHVVTKNTKSPYHRFLGISYPDVAAVESGLRDGLVSTGEAATILDALKGGRRPDWRTSLGGGIGVHGHRRGTDWTGGCAAISDEQVEELFSVLRIGDPVEILP